MRGKKMGEEYFGERDFPGGGFRSIRPQNTRPANRGEKSARQNRK